MIKTLDSPGWALCHHRSPERMSQGSQDRKDLSAVAAWQIEGAM